jgi:hypothetical protein
VVSTTTAGADAGRRHISTQEILMLRIIYALLSKDLSGLQASRLLQDYPQSTDTVILSLSAGFYLFRRGEPACSPKNCIHSDS